ncbi:MAG: hypothetical protein JWQ84_499 [Mucilaginibacter sp.]|nr:hypothetical protein [Mucilaginibacter sp.]MDB5015667.1 hypothetical protein [Mucilaginibacter sp.]MDB5139742.1 hypothetical protein [Mucilaginibacter sp.]
MAAAPHDFFLLPENFFLHKGDKLDLHLLSGDTFVKQQEVRYQPKNTLKFTLFEGSKKTDLTKVAKDSAVPLVDYTMVNTGQALVDMTRIVETDDASRDNFADFLTAQNLDKMAEKVKNGNQFRIRQKYTRYIKTLFSVNDHNGNAYEKVVNDDYEIILKADPYQKKYGDDMSALLMFKGKPAADASISLYIKSISGNVYSQNFITDKKGEINFTMTREGIYLLRSVRVEPTKAQDADYESWWASYTFPFSSSDEVPNTYKEFGFGNKH